jgi:hypothetical protein
MRLSLSDSFKNFYVKNNLLELEKLLSEEEIATLLKSPQKGENPWKQAPETRKALIKSGIGEVVSFLTKKRQIRLGYTLPLFSSTLPLFPKSYRLKDISSVDPVLGGALLCLESSNTSLAESLPDFTKQTPGSVIFFGSDYPIPFADIAAQKNFKGLLVCFTPQKARYKFEPLDPYTHLLKKSGYVFGDVLGEEETPYLYH